MPKTSVQDPIFLEFVSVLKQKSGKAFLNKCISSSNIKNIEFSLSVDKNIASICHQMLIQPFLGLLIANYEIDANEFLNYYFLDVQQFFHRWYELHIYYSLIFCKIHGLKIRDFGSG